MSEILEVSLDTASELWDQLSPTKRQSKLGTWIIYRGHANAKWELKPTLLRQNSLQLLQELSDSSLTYGRLASMEFERLLDFVQSCDANGVEVPSDSLELRDLDAWFNGSKRYQDFPSTWPPDELLETMAFGRLHGLATRLLDWSTNPYVAAYFAASEALLSQGDWVSDQSIAIFELDYGSVSTKYSEMVKPLDIRGSISPNVVAQQGVFTVHPSVGNAGEIVEVKSFEEYLLPSSPPPIKVYKMPVCQVIELHDLCEACGFTASRLYPGPEGAVRSVREFDMYRLAIKNRQG